MRKQIILQYTSIVAELQTDAKYSTSSSKFELDIKNMLNAGYKSVSLSEIIKQRNIFSNDPGDKMFSVVFIGGYIDNYTNAFEIIKHYGIRVTIFIATDLVGLNSYPGVENFIPHFGWAEAQDMIDSDLINIYPLWHYFDQNKIFATEIQNKIKCMNENLVNNGNIIAISGCTIEQFNDAKSYGIEVLLCNFEMYRANNAKNNLIPMICVNYDEDVLDIVEQYLELSNYDSEVKTTDQKVNRKYSLPATTVVLPIESEPIARNYLHISFPFSVIGAKRKDKAERQVANHLIDVIFKPQYDLFDYHCDAYECWECLDCRNVSKDILDINGISVIEYIINGLYLGYYCDVWLDVFYIPGKTGYGTNHFSHGLLVYGYDSIKSILHTISYNSNGFYRNIDVEISNFEKACSNEFLTKISLLKNKPGVNAKYSKKNICEKLKNYIDSYHYDVETSFNKNTSDQYVQYNACLKFSEYIESILNNDADIPSTAIYSYTEHKRLMAWRINYLMKRENLVSEEITNIGINITTISKRLLNLSLKYNMTNNQKYKKRIVDMINLLNSSEKAMIETFLDIITI